MHLLSLFKNEQIKLVLILQFVKDWLFHFPLNCNRIARKERNEKITHNLWMNGAVQLTLDAVGNFLLTVAEYYAKHFVVPHRQQLILEAINYIKYLKFFKSKRLKLDRWTLRWRLRPPTLKKREKMKLIISIEQQQQICAWWKFNYVSMTLFLRLLNICSRQKIVDEALKKLFICQEKQ